MNNTALEICPSILHYHNAVHISYIVWRSCGLLCIIFGIPGHLFSIIILSNKNNRKEPTSLYFLAIACCELIFLLGISWLWFVGMSIIKTDPRQILSCGLFYSILIGSTILSNLYLASMSIDRNFIILYPTRYRLIITRQHVLKRIVLIFLITILFMIPHHFYYYYNKNTTLFICEFHKFIDRWKIHIWPFIHAILFVSIPSIITCISSIMLLHNRRKHRRLTKNILGEKARRIERNSILIVFISLALAFTTLPIVILQIFIVHDRLFNHEIYCLTRWKTYKILLNWFLTLASFSYSCKFYIRLTISRTFRKEFLQLLNCIFRRKDKINEQHLMALNKQNKVRTTSI
ncbi:unnamed protein product [Adineta steineri]|uniref:G-protein coupled receptors family 1 profile domain-containing protein n=2 Tax=Adineta steineri TaxID=433720 RepID=A0A815EG42_9BILA|nr:unnamed protein product [Adineta steineri]CAF1577836.1 unnamed protein product [Adineta steineri]